MQDWFSGCKRGSPSPPTGTSLLKEKANICESQCSLELFCFSPPPLLLIGEENSFFFLSPQMKIQPFLHIRITSIRNNAAVKLSTKDPDCVSSCGY